MTLNIQFAKFNATMQKRCDVAFGSIDAALVASDDADTHDSAGPQIAPSKAAT